MLGSRGWSSDHEPLRHVLIVGGTVEGWLSALCLKQAFPETDFAILDDGGAPLLEPHIATNPDFQRFFEQQLGLDEHAFMRACGANFRTAVKYLNWRIPRDQTPDDHYYRMFDPIPDCDGVSLAHYWLLRRLKGDRQPLEYACHKEPKLLDVRLGPRSVDGSKAMRYGWQLDAEPLLNLLAAQARAAGVVHYPESFASARLAEDGSIESVATRSGLVLEADLFLDCTGTRSLLLAHTLGEPLVETRGGPLCDSVVVSSFANDDAIVGLEPYSSAIALSSGWSWRMPLPGRVAAGYVYSSRFATPEQAAAELCALNTTDSNQQGFRHASFRAGRRRRSWVKNCVGVGPAACYLEPLESNSVDEVLLTLERLALHFPGHSTTLLRDQFNHALSVRFDELEETTRLHYDLAPRDDSEFWRNCRCQRAPRGALPACGAALPRGYHVLAGLGREPLQPPPSLRHLRDSQGRALQMFEQIRQRADELYAQLPTNYSLIQSLHAT